MVQVAIYNAYEYGTPISDEIENAVLVEYATVFLILVSTGFLADALRRFKKQSEAYKDIVLNHRLMYLHISVVSLQAIVSIVVWTIMNVISLNTEDFVLR